MRRAVLDFLGSPDCRYRTARCVFGLALCGLGFSLLVESDLGLDPWDVFHQGLADRVGLPIGTVTVAVGFAVLLLWIPLRQRPGVGTVLNALIIGFSMDLIIPLVPQAGSWPIAWAMLLGGVVLAGIGCGLYIGAGLGPGPRDGLMTGLAGRWGSIRTVRTGIELSALVAGWALGGKVGIGTIVTAVTIGPVVHVTLPRLSLPPRTPTAQGAGTAITPSAASPGPDPGR